MTAASPPSEKVLWRWSAALVGLAWALQLYAIWAPAYPPLTDLSNHLARHYLEYLHLAGRELPPNYAIDYRILPNLGGDLVIPPLMMVLSPAAACKLFLSLAVLLYWLGPALFLFECCGRKPQALAAAVFLLPWSFTGHLFWGFANHYSGYGLAFLVLAHHLWLSRQERIAWPGLLVHALLVAGLFLWHLYPWALYGVMLACHLTATVARRGNLLSPFWTRLRRAFLLALPALPALLLWLYHMLHNRPVPGPSVYFWGGWERKQDLATDFFAAYDDTIDRIVFGLWLAALGVCFGLAVIRKFVVSWLHLAAAVLLVLFLVLPGQMGLASDLDARLLPAILVCLVGTLGFVTPRFFRVAALLLAVCLVLRCGSVASAWNQLSAQLEGHAAGFAVLERHSRVLPIALLPELSPRYPGVHFVCWAVIEKEVFVPVLFCLPDQHMLRIAPGYLTASESFDDFYFWDEYEGDEEKIRGRYDYLWLYNPLGKRARVPPSFTRIYSRDGVEVWRIP
jgi:hypothetical protein